MHLTSDPAILYFGTPVVLVSTTNEDGSANLAPISSAWWLGRQCLLGFGAASHTPRNLHRTSECVLNLPSVEEVSAVDRLALLTGSDPPPPHKLARGYRHEKDKFGAAGLTPVPSELVGCPRVAQCPVQLEAVLEAEHPVGASKTGGPPALLAFEVRVVRVHLDERVLMEGEPNRVDPLRWRPLMMSFCRFFGLGPEVHPSRLAQIPEESYRPRQAGSPVPIRPVG